jgi:hypothetical protein
MAVDKAGMGRLAVTLLLHRIEFGEESVTSTLVRPQLIERQTVATLAVESPAVAPLTGAAKGFINAVPRPMSAADPA